ncbi:MAG: MerR family transcriptional regulator [Candidatus Competibacter sp.]
MNESLWRLDELVQRSRRLLALLPEEAGASKRVRWQPNERLVRYYTTLGLLDRPAELRGRTAYYCDRHLLQLLAIKTLQSRGLNLQTVQEELAGQTDARLATLIGLPPDWRTRPAIEARTPTAEKPPAGSVAEPVPVGERFWERAPSTVSSATLVACTPTRPVLPAAELLELTLAPGARLLLDRRRYPKPDHRLNDALQTLSAALRTVAHAPEENSDAPD